MTLANVTSGQWRGGSLSLLLTLYGAKGVGDAVADGSEGEKKKERGKKEKEGGRWVQLLAASAGIREENWGSPLLRQDLRLLMGLESISADLSSRKEQQKHNQTNIWFSEQMPQDGTGGRMGKAGTHFQHHDFHLHIGWQIHFRLETPHHGNQQVNSRQQVFVVDDWRTGGAATETLGKKKKKQHVLTWQKSPTFHQPTGDKTRAFFSNQPGVLAMMSIQHVDRDRTLARTINMNDASLKNK